jgi:hypothetical protein
VEDYNDTCMLLETFLIHQNQPRVGLRRFKTPVCDCQNDPGPDGSLCEESQTLERWRSSFHRIAPGQTASNRKHITRLFKPRTTRQTQRQDPRPSSQQHKHNSPKRHAVPASTADAWSTATTSTASSKTAPRAHTASQPEAEMTAMLPPACLPMHGAIRWPMHESNAPRFSEAGRLEAAKLFSSFVRLKRPFGSSSDSDSDNYSHQPCDDRWQRSVK